MKNRGICKLCLKESKLCRSHIIPEFFYEKIYDKNPQNFFSIWTKGIDGKHKKEQKGLREMLLCASCETLFSKYEKTASEVLYAPNRRCKATIADVITKNNMTCYRFRDVDKDFKYFQMSLLWRILISTSFFVDLPDKEIVAEEIRLKLNSQENANHDFYGCLMQEIIYPQGNPASGFIFNPYLTEISKGFQCLNLLIDGFLFTYFLSSKSVPVLYSKHFLDNEGNMTVIKRQIVEDQILFDGLKQTYSYYSKRIKPK